MPFVQEPARVRLHILSLQEIRRHNSLEPQLQETDRVLLRWSETGGSGLPNHEAEIREMHYDPLPPDLCEKVDEVVDGGPWKTLTIKWYRSPLDRKVLAEQLRISRNQLYVDWRCSLWYYRGCFERLRIYG